MDRTAGFLRWSGSFFPQDGDALAATARLTWRLTRAATTTLALYDASGGLVRTVWTNRSQAAGTRTWTWDGRLADGTYAPQGAYTAMLTVRVAVRHSDADPDRVGRGVPRLGLACDGSGAAAC